MAYQPTTLEWHAHRVNLVDVDVAAVDAAAAVAATKKWKRAIGSGDAAYCSAFVPWRNLKYKMHERMPWTDGGYCAAAD